MITIRINVLTGIILLASLCISGHAYAQNNSTLDVRIIYSTNTTKAELTYNSAIEYPTTVMVMMSEGENTVENPDNIVMIEEADCDELSEVKLTFDLGLENEDKTYNFYAYCGGYAHVMGEAQKTGVTVYGTDTTDSALTLINNEPSQSLAAKICEQVGEKLFLTSVDGDLWRNKYIYAIKTTDFGGSFKCLEDVYSAWSMSTIINSISNGNASDITEILAGNSELLKLDLSDEDYLLYTDEVSRLLKAYCASVTTFSDFAVAYNEALAVASINISSNKGEKLRKYAVNLGISDLMTEYEKKEESILNRFEGKTFENSTSVREYLVSVINSLKTPPPSFGGGGGGGGGGGSSKPASSPVMPSMPEMNVESTEFNDIESTHWALSSVMALNKLGIISGYEDGSFRPNNNVTREEFVKLIVEAFDIISQNTECDFEDISADAWFKKYVSAAVENGIIKGIDENHFGVGQSIRRQDAAVILDRVLDMADISITSSVSFSDADTIGDYAFNSVLKLSDAGIINGIDGGFAPHEPVSRAQAAKLIYESLEYRDNSLLQ